MLSLEQIKLLEKKVEKAISVIKNLTDERDALKVKLVEKDKRIAELEDLVVNFKDDQTMIENGIKNTLNLLNSLEDLATTSSATKETSAQDSTQSKALNQQANKQKQDDLAQILGKPNSVAQNQEQVDIF